MIRVLHRIYSDVTTMNLGKLSPNRKRKVRSFLHILVENLGEIDYEKIKKLLILHSEVQPWHENLFDGIKPTLERIKVYYSSLKRLGIIK